MTAPNSTATSEQPKPASTIDPCKPHNVVACLDCHATYIAWENSMNQKNPAPNASEPMVPNGQVGEIRFGPHRTLIERLRDTETIYQPDSFVAAVLREGAGRIEELEIDLAAAKVEQERLRAGWIESQKIALEGRIRDAKELADAQDTIEMLSAEQRTHLATLKGLAVSENREDRQYTPEELLHVAERTLIPQDMHKRAALLGVIAAFGDPDKIYATPPGDGLKYQAGEP